VKNPAKEAALDFLETVLTRYLGVRREEVAKEFIKTLSLEVEAFYPYGRAFNKQPLIALP